MARSARFAGLYMRGGVHAPLPPAELETKFMDNVEYGGWRRDMGERFKRVAAELFPTRISGH